MSDATLNLLRLIIILFWKFRGEKYIKVERCMYKRTELYTLIKWCYVFHLEHKMFGDERNGTKKKDFRACLFCNSKWLPKISFFRQFFILFRKNQ